MHRYPALASATPPQLPLSRGPRRHLVTGLLRASALLLHAAVRLQHRPAAVAAAPARPAELEFYAEAGAPEGALYSEGELVGRLPGVQRL